VLGILFFSFLLYCLLYRTRQNLGTYRYLQVFNFDHSPAIMVSDSHDYYRLLCAYLSLYNLTFVIIGFSFLYRMWAVKSPLLVRHFSHPLFIFLLFSIASFESAVWSDS
ncbi:hypothetical protein PENTCL1PPCAC_16362, partial [Pristionchus entomophagus]